MKKIYILMISALAAIGFYACDGDEDGDLTGGILGSMSATIDGETWTSAQRTTTVSDMAIVIQGTAIDKKTLVITVNGTDEGVYELNPLTLKAGFAAVLKDDPTQQNTDDMYIAKTGIVDITEINTSTQKMTGTFNFKMLKAGFDTISVTGGVFNNLKYNEPEVN